jgi:F0F1-type ATP synthase membrane subunit c/vacuolar-type H+-ATPase subunit K
VETAELVQALAYLGAGIAMGFGAIGAGVGEGYAAHQACGGISRQPAVSSPIQRTMLIGQAMAESASVFALIVAMMLIFVVDVSGATVLQGVAFVGAGIAVGFGAIGGGIGCGFPAGSACQGVARRPEGQNQITTFMLIGQGVSQTPSVLSFVIALILIYRAFEGDSMVAMAAVLGAGISVGMGAIGCGIGSGYAGGDACAGVGRWPASRGALLRTMLVGQAVSQSTSIYALLIAILMIFVA